MKYFKINTELVIREDDLKVLIQHTGNVVQINKFGLFVIKYLQKNESILDVLDAIKRSFDTTDLDNAQLEGWLISFLCECKEVEIGNFE